MTITAADVIAEVRKVAAADPDRVYTYMPGSGLCFYLHRDGYNKVTPGCIIGHALWNLKVIDENSNAGLYGAVRDSLHALHIHGTDFENRWLSHVQNRQDNRAPWGEAVASADTARPEVKAL